MNLKAKEGLSVSDMIVVGFALFSMFFGAASSVNAASVSAGLL